LLIQTIERSRTYQTPLKYQLKFRLKQELLLTKFNRQLFSTPPRSQYHHYFLRCLLIDIKSRRRITITT